MSSFQHGMAIIRMVSKYTETDNRYDASFAATVVTTVCRRDNMWCLQWRQSWHNDDYRFSVYSMI